MSGEGDPILSIFTAVLSGVTAVLVWVTWRLGNITKQVGEQSDAIKIMPLLTFDNAVTYLDGTTEFVRFSFTNVGPGPAEPSTPRVQVIGGRVLETRPVTMTEFAIPNVAFNFDIYGAKADEEVNVEIDYTDMKGKNKQTFSKTVTIKPRT